MNIKQVEEFHKWFRRLARELGATSTGNHHSILVPGTDDYSYGHYVQTKYGMLTFYLDLEEGHHSTFNLMAKFLEPTKLPKSTGYTFDTKVNGVRVVWLSGKWNLHLGVVDPKEAKKAITDMLNPLGLFDPVEQVKEA